MFSARGIRAPFYQVAGRSLATVLCPCAFFCDRHWVRVVGGKVSG